jgi:hypothetical protein
VEVFVFDIPRRVEGGKSRSEILYQHIPLIRKTVADGWCRIEIQDPCMLRQTDSRELATADSWYTFKAM